MTYGRDGGYSIGEADDGVADHFTKSEVFSRTFREGMALVEETAAYLDGQGRDESKSLSRGAALAYAGESMRLTTRLMQIASWLLVQRAVREGEITSDEAGEQKYRLGAKESDQPIGVEYAEQLPTALRLLMQRCDRLFERVVRIDQELYRTAAEERRNDVARQLLEVERAFAGR